MTKWQRLYTDPFGRDFNQHAVLVCTVCQSPATTVVTGMDGRRERRCDEHAGATPQEEPDVPAVP